MKHLLGIAGLILTTGFAYASNEDAFLGNIQPPSERTIGQGRSALWTLSDVATQYQPSQPTSAMQAALQAQSEGRFLDALILLEDALKGVQTGADTQEETNLLRASFLLQGDQPRQALDMLATLPDRTRHAADAHALAAMAHLQLGQMREALDAARHARDLGEGMLPHLALSYALQGSGRLREAREVMHGFNARRSDSITPQAISLAREAELALTLNQVQSARELVNQAQTIEAGNTYVIAVSGLTYLIDGHASEAKAAFETALRRDQRDAKALFGLGLAEIRLGNFQIGQKKFQAAHEADPGNALVLTYLGRSQQQSGQIEAAMSSWHSAQLADSNDPTPWLYQAQAELQANLPLEARESLREAEARTANRSVYRGENLLREDLQLLQANSAEIQRRLGLESLAFQTLNSSTLTKNSANLRNQADVLQGQRFAESARRSLLLQSLFNEKPGNLQSSLDIYGDGAGQTGASTPQHGAVSALSSQQVSFNDYDELFGQRTILEADGIAGSRNTGGEQIRVGVGSDKIGLTVAGRQFKTDGYAPFQNLDNKVWQGIAQWRPTQYTQAFLSYQTYKSQHGETFFAPEPLFSMNDAMLEKSHVTRLGLRHSLTDSSELRALSSLQRTYHVDNYYDMSVPAIYIFSSNSSSKAHSEELQYRNSGTTYSMQWGMQQFRGRLTDPGMPVDFIMNARQIYAAWQHAPNPYWQLDAGLGYGKMDNRDNLKTFIDNSTNLEHWLPKFGAVYAPDDVTHLRLAAWQGMGVPAVGDAALAPVSLAGILLIRPADYGQLAHGIALGGDRQLSSTLMLEAGAQQRRTDQPVVYGGQQIFFKQHIDESRLSLHWQSKPWAVSLAYEDERIRNDPTSSALNSVDEQHLYSQQLGIRWFAGERCTANLKWSHNHVTGTYRLTDTILWTPTLMRPYRHSFNQLDTDLDWKFNSFVSLTAGVRNVFDKRLQYLDTSSSHLLNLYSDIDPLNPRFSNGRLLYANLRIIW